MVFAQQSQQWAQGTLLQNIVAALWAITSDVTEGPDGLFPDVVDGRREELDELWDGTSVDHGLCMLCGAGGDVRERPCCLELKNYSIRHAATGSR